MLTRSITSTASSRSVAHVRAIRPADRCVRRTTVRVQAKKSKEQELQDAYEEQLAYLERRRQKLIAPRIPKQKGVPAGQPAAPSPVVQAQAPKVKQATAKSEPSIKVELEDGNQKKSSNPLGFLSSLFGAK